MHTPWIGPRRVAVIPAVVNDPQYNPPPSNWVEQIQQRLYYDPDPNTGIDRSLRSYINTISYGKALLEADVFNPVTVQPCDLGAAINVTPAAASYQFACVVFMGGTHSCVGWAFWDNPPFSFNPPITPDNLRNWYRVHMGESLGVWAMETMHALTAFGDLYFANPNPGNFDNMACSCGTHPSTFTKWKLGWLDPGDIVTAPAYTASTFILHALELLQPPPPGRVTAVRIPSTISQRYFLVEARLRIDAYDRPTPGISSGIPSEGVVIYEIDEAAWPVQLRTPIALSVGQNYTNSAEQLEIDVSASVPGGFAVSIRSTENPACAAIRDQIADAEGEIADLRAEFPGATPAEKASIGQAINRQRAIITRARQQGRFLGCRLP